MSEKQFEIKADTVDSTIINITKDGEVFAWFLSDDITDKQAKKMCDFMNWQQATIIKQDEEIKKLKRTERSWRRIHCCNKESDNCGIVIEQEATIKQLKEENDDLRFALRTEQAFARVEKDKKPFLSKEEFLKELEDEANVR